MRKVSLFFVIAVFLANAGCGDQTSCQDEDGDGFGVGEECQGPDCDDQNPDCQSGSCCEPEPDCTDEDQDGFGTGPDCRGPDCDDQDPFCHEGACCDEFLSCAEVLTCILDCDADQSCILACMDSIQPEEQEYLQALTACAQEHACRNRGCLVDSCPQELAACQGTSGCIDQDGDGYGQGDGCLGPDCDDQDADCHSGDCCGSGCPDPAPRTVLDLAYHEETGVDPNLLSLDLYLPARPDACALAPVVVWVHGGGWKTGDKRNHMGDKIALFNGAGYVLASANYRLSPDPPDTEDPGRIMHPVHVQDLARALAWLHDHVGDHGGDPERVAIIGHSAGAHLVALAGTDERRLGAHGLDLGFVRCIASIDTQAYNLPAVMEGLEVGSDPYILFTSAFGTDPAGWEDTSPILHLAPDKGIGEFLFARRGSATRQARLAAFREALDAVGVGSVEIDATSLSHAEVNAYIGMPGDTIMTPPLMEFFGNCLKTPADFGHLEFTLEERGPGTEVNYVVEHEGSLFANVSTWNASNPATPVRILRKDAYDSPWMIEFELPKTAAAFHTRSSIMGVFTFTSDVQGNPLDPPVALLIMGSGKQSQDLEAWRDMVFTRTGPGDWQPTVINADIVRPCDGRRKSTVRSLEVYPDPVLGRDVFLVGTGSGKVFRGGYDPQAPGLLSFEPDPLFQGAGRIMSIKATPWGLYASCSRKPAPEDCPEVSGLPEGLIRYTDGSDPVDVQADPWGAFTLVDLWETDYRSAEDACRGLTILPHPDLAGEQVLACGAQDPGHLVYWEGLPDAPARVLELDLPPFLNDAFDTDGFSTSARIGPYNEFTPYTHPDTGEQLHLIGLYVKDGRQDPLSYFLVRHLDGTYEPFDIPALDDVPLRGVRTILPSPFPEDQGRVLYFGGFDAHNGPHPDTAWLFKGKLPAP